MGQVLAEAPCDVAVLVERERRRSRVWTRGMPIVVPFGGAEHDWAALELGAWIAAVRGAPLRLLSSAGATPRKTPAGRSPEQLSSSSSSPRSPPSHDS